MSNEKMYLYHTNDIHSDLTYWPRIAQELNEKRVIREENGDFVLAFDIGDATDRVHPLTEATNGQAITQLLNEGNYDAVTIGNNEGITNSKEELNRLYDDANFPVILTNVFDPETGETPKWAKPYKIIETPWGDRVGIFGLTTPLYETYERLGWKITNPVKQAQELFRQHRHEADFWILLSHLGIDEDRYLAKLFPIPVIIGAHTHHALLEGEVVAGTTLTGAGQFGNWLGEIVIGRDHHGKLKVESAQLLEAETQIQPFENEEQIVAGYTKSGHDLLQKDKIAVIPEKLPYNWQTQSRLADITLDAIADFADTEVAILNAGLFMADINQGIVTADELHRALPHPIRVMRCRIKGKYLLEYAEELERLDEQLIDQPVRGYGFRGQVFGMICLKGLTVKPGEVKWLGKDLEMEKEYELATIDYFSFLPFFDTLNKNSKQDILFPHFIRTVVGAYFTKKHPIKNETYKKGVD